MMTVTFLLWLVYLGKVPTEDKCSILSRHDAESVTSFFIAQFPLLFGTPLLKGSGIVAMLGNMQDLCAMWGQKGRDDLSTKEQLLWHWAPLGVCWGL